MLASSKPTNLTTVVDVDEIDDEIESSALGDVRANVTTRVRCVPFKTSTHCMQNCCCAGRAVSSRSSPVNAPPCSRSLEQFRTDLGEPMGRNHDHAEFGNRCAIGHVLTRDPYTDVARHRSGWCQPTMGTLITGTASKLKPDAKTLRQLSTTSRS